MYLFDRQGSYLFLNEDADLSWFIIRSEKGMENSIQKALEFGAPDTVITALKERKVVLSLYEECDFSSIREKLFREQLKAAKKNKKDEKEAEVETEIKIELNWDKYLHPASVFESKINRLEALGVTSDGSNSGDTPSKYYYAFIKDFPEHGIDKSRILSYKEFLSQASQIEIK